jgi:hypothetical protein
MDQDTLRLIIQKKLVDGRLPYDSIPRVWGGAGTGETCHACDLVIAAPALVMEGIAGVGTTPLQLHVQCFYIWDAERRNADGSIGN